MTYSSTRFQSRKDKCLGTYSLADVLSHRYETVLGMRTVCVSVFWQVGLHTGLGLHMTSCQVVFIPTAHFILSFIKCTCSTYIFLEALVYSSRYSIRSNHVFSRGLERCGCHLVLMQSSAVNSSTKRCEMLQCSCSHHRPNCLMNM